VQHHATAQHQLCETNKEKEKKKKKKKSQNSPREKNRRKTNIKTKKTHEKLENENKTKKKKKKTFAFVPSRPVGNEPYGAAPPAAAGAADVAATLNALGGGTIDTERLMAAPPGPVGPPRRPTPLFGATARRTGKFALLLDGRPCGCFGAGDGDCGALDALVSRSTPVGVEPYIERSVSLGCAGESGTTP
jgi:hypothetical protein